MDSPRGNSLSGENVVGFQMANHEKRNRNRPSENLCVLEPRQRIQIPAMEASEYTQKFHIRKICKDFFTNEGCSHGNNCNFLHGGPSEVRECEAIWLVNNMSGDDRTNRSKPPLDPAGLVNDMSGYGRTNRIKPPLNPSKLKTRICYNWDHEGVLPLWQQMSLCSWGCRTASLQW